MDSELVKALSEFFSCWPGAAYGPISEAELEKEESDLGIRLPEDYRDFILRYGGAVVGNSVIYGTRQSEFGACDPVSFAAQTRIFRKEVPLDFAEMVVISVDQSGNPIGFISNDNVVFVYDFDFGGRLTLAESFSDFIRQCLPTRE